MPWKMILTLGIIIQAVMRAKPSGSICRPSVRDDDWRRRGRPSGHPSVKYKVGELNMGIKSYVDYFCTLGPEAL